MPEAADSDKSPALSLRSCHRCNQKKIRCNKAQPCEGCVKTSSECVYPGPGRAPRRKKRALKAELVSRVKNLEQELRLLAKGGETTSEDAPPPCPSDHEAQGAEDHRGEGSKHGKLFVKGSSTQYFTHEVLVNLVSQVEELKDLMGPPGNDVSEYEESLYGDDGFSQKGTQFLFGFSCMAASLEAFHPSMTHSQILWKAYQDNVAPVTMIFHQPTLLKTMYKAAANNSYVDHASEAVVFAVYFAAVNSLDTEECAEMLAQDQSSLREYYKFATQQALARAGFLQSRSLTVLQAAVLFLTCLRGPGDAYFVWTMTGAIHRMAQGLGLHRDGTPFGLSPFDTEMRRRLWWSIYLLDSRSSEFHATDTQITEDHYDTKIPLNINDSDISPESNQVPESHVGFTEMTFCLTRIEMTIRYRRSVLNSQGDGNSSSSDKLRLLDERLHGLEQIHGYLRQRYLKFCDVTVPLQWATATIIRLALARSWLTAHISQRTGTEQIPSLETMPDDPKRDQLFLTAIEVVEFAHLLETDSRTSKWSWLFEGYPQWQAAAVVLMELCVRPQAAGTQRAWVVVEKAVTSWVVKDYQEGSITMKTVSCLMERAAAVHGYNWSISEINAA
ncbi:Zn(II)2Cys6 transcription factor [Aspergillus melleus]|uniref:Zn(II)2Cys6 transcription factor n=1 Tax=Aspergillus melleus TaxID=138277 RepID=UPI001E8CFB12|nr:uncharacterized protein LDX57_000316 [Aspergillus melleus]KAH8422563.1 hypothetical protein LDX57_000316 [Aspergillus melleus]